MQRDLTFFGVVAHVFSNTACEPPVNYFYVAQSSSWKNSQTTAHRVAIVKIV